MYFFILVAHSAFQFLDSKVLFFNYFVGSQVFASSDKFMVIFLLSSNQQFHFKDFRQFSVSFNSIFIGILVVILVLIVLFEMMAGYSLFSLVIQ